MVDFCTEVGLKGGDTAEAKTATTVMVERGAKVCVMYYGIAY